MSEFIDERGEIDWKVVFELLGSGQPVDLPCYSESDYLRRSKQAAKRTEKHGIPVEIVRVENAIRLQPRERSDAADGENGLSRMERRQRRAQRREAARAESEP
jgi:hypothetical protein